MLGLVACRGYDSEDAFYGMTARAVNKGAQAIVGYVALMDLTKAGDFVMSRTYEAFMPLIQQVLPIFAQIVVQCSD